MNKLPILGVIKPTEPTKQLIHKTLHELDISPRSDDGDVDNLQEIVDWAIKNNFELSKCRIKAVDTIFPTIYFTEEKFSDNPLYNEQMKIYLQILSEYEKRVEAYEKELEVYNKKQKESEIQAARNLLEDEGFLVITK